MKTLTDLKKEITRLEKSGKLSVDQGVRLRKYFKKLEHAVAVKDNKEVKKYVYLFCEAILEI